MTYIRLGLLHYNAVANILTYPLRASITNWSEKKSILAKVIYQFIILELWFLLLDTYVMCNVYYVFYQNRLSSRGSPFIIFGLITLSNHGYPEFLLSYLFVMFWLFMNYITSRVYPPFLAWLHKEIGNELLHYLAGNPLGSESIKPLGIIFAFSFARYLDYFITAKRVYHRALKRIEDLGQSDPETPLDIERLEALYQEVQTEVGRGLFTWADDFVWHLIVHLLNTLKDILKR